MEDSPDEKITRMVDLLLDMKYDQSFGEPSWKKIVTVVDVDYGGGDKSLARAIAEKHPMGWSI